MTDPLAWLAAVADERSRAGLSRQLQARGEASPGRIVLDGRTLVNFASNDYLGLACDPRLAEAARRASERHGWGAGASPLVSGWTDAHQELVEALARFEKAEAVALFPTGFAANLGAMAALVGKGDAVYVDRLDHASLVDGVRLSGASLRVFPHNDVERLAAVLDRDQGRFRRSLIAVDGVFGMDGDLAPIAELVDLAERTGAMLLVDEAHGTGVFGPDGRGACSAVGRSDRVPIRVGTLSKAFGSLGGFVAGSHALIHHIWNFSPTFLYSTALPPAAAAAATAALAISEAEPWRRQRCLDLGRRLREGLADLGLGMPGAVGPIVPVVIGEAEPTLVLARSLRDRGFLVGAIRPPTVPRGTARLRVTVTAAHSEADIDAFVEALREPMASAREEHRRPD